MKVLALFAILLVAASAMSLKEKRLKTMNKLTYSSLFTEITS
jgi:hypothetical protein